MVTTTVRGFVVSALAWFLREVTLTSQRYVIGDAKQTTGSAKVKTDFVQKGLQPRTRPPARPAFR